MSPRVAGVVTVTSLLTAALGISAAQSNLAKSGTSSSISQKPSPVSTPVSAMPAVIAPPPSLLFSETHLPGDYYFGDGLGVNCSLTLTNDHYFTFRWTGCVGEYDRNQGRWEMQGDMLVLIPERPKPTEGFSGINVRFVPVLWGKKVYLVDEYEMPGFCATAGDREKSLLDDIHGLDYAKLEETPGQPRTGKPVLPARYEEFYAKGEVIAHVAAAKTDGTVTLKRQGNRPLEVGMRLVISGYEGIEVRVTSAAGDAEPLYYPNAKRKIRVGDTVTTGSYYHRPHGTRTPRQKAFIPHQEEAESEVAIPK